MTRREFLRLQNPAGGAILVTIRYVLSGLFRRTPGVRRLGLIAEGRMGAPNPLLEAILDYLNQGKELRAVLPERTGEPKRNVTFKFSDGTAGVRTFQCGYETFLAWWQSTVGYLKNARSAADVFVAAPAPKRFVTVHDLED